jgi:hypothetical protein
MVSGVAAGILGRAVDPQHADAPEVWGASAEDLTATQVPEGHFSPEEAPGSSPTPSPPSSTRTNPASEWAIVDSNHGPPPYQSGALTD